MSEMVAVFSFKICDPATGITDVRPIKGTLEAIERARAEALEETKEMVDPALLDGAGYYRRSN